ncbi:MAG: hypothetical protein ABJB47_22520 [Actinomycetota bacterium]
MGVSTRQRTSGGRQSLLRSLMHRPAMISSSGARITVTVLILTGAAATVLSGLIHLKLWGGSTGYHVIPTIGPLFLVQAISGVAIGLATAVSRRLFFVLASAGLLAGTALGLFITVEHGLFGFRENWGAPYATSSLWEEIIGAVILLAAAVPLAMAKGTKAAR